MENVKREKSYRWTAYILFACAVPSVIWSFNPFNLPLLSAAYWMAVCGAVFLYTANWVRRVRELECSGKFKDAVIQRMEEQRRDMHNEIEQLTEECKVARADKCKTEAVAERSLPEIPIPTLLDKLQVRITATEDMVLLVMDNNLYLQPKEERGHWWKLRGYDTTLPNPAKTYYIYIRLSIKGADAELRFLHKANLNQNENHRFIKVGAIGPVADGKRSVQYTLDTFRFKRVKSQKQ